MSWTDEATADLVRRLEASADDATRAYWTRYLRGAARFRGVPMAGVRAAVVAVCDSQRVRDRPVEDGLALAHRWFAQPDSEDKLAAVLLLAEQLRALLTLEHVDDLARPLVDGHVADWSSCDWYATKALHGFLTAAPAEVEARARAVARWSEGANVWHRRAGVVAFVKLAPRGDEVFPGFVALLLNACAANLVSDDRFAHTGPGWVLRELSRAAPDAVQEFAARHPQLSPEGRRMATARLRQGVYRRR